MRNKVSVTVITILSIALVAVLLFRLIAPDTQPPEIVLPAITAQETPGSNDSLGLDFFDQGEIASDALYSIIEGLKVTQEFSHEYSITDYWSGGSKVLYYSVKAKQDVCLITEYSVADRADKYVLIRGELVTIWEDDDRDTVYRGSPPALDHSALRDWYQRLYTIEDILGLDPENIIYASFADVFGSPCIYIEFIDREHDIISELIIGTETGLVISEKRTEAGQTIYEMVNNSINLTPPDDRIFYFD
jgi:hypothetical protein